VTFLDAVNRILRTTGVIKGDDDNITTFSDVQHNATLNLAQIAIQSELNALVADAMIPYERDTKTIVTVIGTRVYDLDPSFVRFWGTPLLYNAVANRLLPPYDEDRLRQEIYNYQTAANGNPIHWYFVGGTTKKIGFYPIPNAVETWSYEIEKFSGVTSSGDVLPFQTEQEAQVFCNLAARHFLILFEEKPERTLTKLADDPIYKAEKATLFALIAGVNPAGFYGKRYA
jgi:hypothetical protein